MNQKKPEQTERKTNTSRKEKTKESDKGNEKISKSVNQIKSDGNQNLSPVACSSSAHPFLKNSPSPLTEHWARPRRQTSSQSVLVTAPTFPPVEYSQILLAGNESGTEIHPVELDRKIKTVVVGLLGFVGRCCPRLVGGEQRRRKVDYYRQEHESIRWR